VRRARLVAFAAIALCGCRAVLGIETLTVDEDASTPNEDGAVNDSAGDTTVPPTGDDGKDGASDSALDAPADHAGPQPDGPPGASDAGCADAGQMCPVCCRNTLPTAVGRLEAYAIDAGCLCNPGNASATCYADAGNCGSTVCENDFSAQLDMGCANCVDPTIGPGNACSGATPKNECTSDPSCRPYLDCLGSCPH
jgi:hypothetical protein